MAVSPSKPDDDDVSDPGATIFPFRIMVALPPPPLQASPMIL